MINKITSANNSPKFCGAQAAGAKGKSLMTKIVQSKGVEKVLGSDRFFNAMKAAGKNPVVWQSACAFGICVGPRPLTNYIVTEDKKDATYANCHSISSGAIGLIWPIIFATPIVAAVAAIAKNPTGLKPEVIKRFYSDVKMEKVLAADGKTYINKIVTDKNGNMLREDGSELCMSLEPLLIIKEENRPKFNAKYPNFSVDKSGVVRIKPVQRADGGWDHIQTEKGVGKFKIVGDKAVPVGEPVQARDFRVEEDGSITKPIYKTDADGYYVMKENEKTGDMEKFEIGRAPVEEKDFTTVTEAMEIGARKEGNTDDFIKMFVDVALAPIRASLTIALIPPLLNAFGIRKSSNSNGGINYVSTSNNSVLRAHRPGDIATSFSSFRKGGVQ